ncbi:hypothetical protein SSX86_001055 [Deinandra increscens subsp. villosa]|uniref:TPM domain-containing protein n=1 Tax=Deinandra increscens subsp. villosa TaxID=3103831 RepID=A0AAP0DQX4_9ASTR
MEKYFGNAYRGDPGVPHSGQEKFLSIWIGSIAFSAITWSHPYIWQLSNRHNWHDHAMLFEQYHWKKALQKKEKYKFSWNENWSKAARDSYYINWPVYFPDVHNGDLSSPKILSITMAILQLHSFRFRNTSTNFSHVVATGASTSSSSVSSHQSVSTPKLKHFDRLVSKFKSNSLSFALSGTLALAVTLSGVGFAEAKVGVNKPELLPKEFTTVIDVAGFLSDGQEKRLAKEIDSIEKDTGFKLRVLAQNYPDTPGLAIKDFWQVDDRTIVFVADPTFGNILNFNVGETVDLDIPRSFWSRLAGKYGNMFYWKEKGEDASVEAAVMAISNCLREPVGASNCAEVK